MVDGWTLGWLEVAPVAIALVIVLRHRGAERRAANVERERERPPRA